MDNDGRQHRNSNEPRPSTPGHSQVPAGSQVNPSSMDSLIAGMSNLQSPTRPIFSRILPVVTSECISRPGSFFHHGGGHHGGSMGRNVAHSSRSSFARDYNMRMPSEEPIPTLNDLLYPPSEMPKEFPIPMRRVEINRKRFHSSSSQPITSSEHQRSLERRGNNLIYTTTIYYVFPKRTKLENMRNVSIQVSPGRIEARFQRTPQIMAFNIHLISDMIFKKVSMNDLKSCRLVSKLMNKMSSRSMESRLKTVSLTYKFHWGLGKFVRDSLNNENADPTPREYLENLIACLDMSKKGHHFNSFPCSNFTFHLGDMNSPDIKNFFELYGHRVKTLSITYEDSVDVSSLSQLKQLLRVLNQVPNIVTLDLSWFYQPDDLVKALKADIIIEDHVQTELSRLKTLQFACSPGFDFLLEKIMAVAPNLEELNCSHHLEVLVEDEKVRLVKHFEFSPDDSNLVFLDRMSEADLAIKTLRIDLTRTHWKRETWSQVAKILKKFLESTQNTLIDLSITPLAFLPEFQLPDLLQLKTLEFYAPHKAHEKSLYKNVAFLPTATNISRVMMNLTTIKFTSGVTSLLRDYIDDYFPRDNNSVPQFVNVTTLECGMSSTDVHARLAELFPKVKQLKLNLSNFYLNSLWVIWNNWEAIEFLELNDPIIDYAYSYDRPPILDSVFTGIPASKCVTLRQHDQVQNCTWEQGPSITKLKQLKSLVLKIGEVLHWPTTYESNPFFSHVSFLYGFNLIPQLKVIVDISTESHQDYITRALEPCLPRITLKV